MKTERELNEWFNSLGGETLIRMLPDIWHECLKRGGDEDEFIESCDGMWDDMPINEKENFYSTFMGW